MIVFGELSAIPIGAVGFGSRHGNGFVGVIKYHFYRRGLATSQ
ncbi:MAG: hypothetical protein AAF546_09100 [Verrucomicrobiota bacterium]